jgi:hypothetical protein
VLRQRVLEAVQPQQQADTAEAASHIPLTEEPKSPKSGMKRRHRKLSTLQQVLQETVHVALLAPHRMHAPSRCLGGAYGLRKLVRRRLKAPQRRQESKRRTLRTL